jgi:hypothetical protein
MNSYEELKSKNLSTQDTAIVVIDVWDDTNLHNFVTTSLNPFLEKAKEDGYILINAPSQGKANQNLTQVFDYTIYNFEPIFPILKENLIKNIVYVGYDKILCVLDKPAGAFHLKNLGFNYNMYVLGSLSVSSMREFDVLSKHFFNELGVTNISTNDLVGVDFSYNVKYWKKFNKKLNIKKLSGNKPLIILFNNEKGEHNNLLSRYNIPILEVTESQSDFNTYRLMQFIKTKNISDIIYAGYYADSSILFHELGVLNIYIKKKYYDRNSINLEMPRVFLLEDLFFSKNHILDPKETMSLLSNHYRGIGLTNLNTISSQQAFSTYYDLVKKFYELRKKLKMFICSHTKLVVLALVTLIFLNFILALLFFLNHLFI